MLLIKKANDCTKLVYGNCLPYLLILWKIFATKICMFDSPCLFILKNSSSLDKSFGIWDIRQSIVDEKGQYHSYIRNGVVSNSENFN